ncbi:MAG TPA: helix-turn-helix domain-containing protein [Vicinamibacteria bacterium]|nr:helix-turn-helix domain-containing protein [Vicinamibacteria bacterium]
MSPPVETHYAVLGIGPRATTEQVDSAYRHAAGLYDDESLATYSLLDGDERATARGRVEAAYSVLRDPRRRHEYDVSLGLAPAGSTPTFAVVEARPASGRAPVVVLPDPVTGPDLKRFRESRGIPLREIAAASKVGVRFLEYIEAERVEVLPAPVYLRGFVQEYARVVGLDPRPTAESYLARVNAR